MVRESGHQGGGDGEKRGSNENGFHEYRAHLWLEKLFLRRIYRTRARINSTTSLVPAASRIGTHDRRHR